MTTPDLDKQIRELVGKRILETLQDDEEGRKAAIIGKALEWLDGKGRKHEGEEEVNEYAQQSRKGARGTMPPVDTESDDPATT